MGAGNEDWSDYEIKETITKTVLKGDINGDGKINISDLVGMKMHIVESDEITDEEVLKTGDIDGDGRIGTSDLRLMADYLTGNIGDKEWGDKYKNIDVEVVKERRYTQTLDKYTTFENGKIKLNKGDSVTIVEKRQPDGTMVKKIVRINFGGDYKSEAELDLTNGDEIEIATYGKKMAKISGGTATVTGASSTYNYNFRIQYAENCKIDIFGNNAVIDNIHGENLINVTGSGGKIYGGINDKITVDGENCSVDLGRGINEVTVNGNGATIYGGTGPDTIAINADNVKVYSDEGDDRIIINGKNAIVHGGYGNDAFVVNPQCNNAIILYYDPYDGDGYDIINDNLEFSDELGQLTASYSKDDGGIVISTVDGQKLITLKGFKDKSSLEIIQKQVDAHNKSVQNYGTIKEKITGSERIFYVEPGYYYDQTKEEGGLYVTNINVDNNLDKNKAITFDLYNTLDAIGFVEYYDENGKFIRADKIAPHSTVVKDWDSWWEKTKNTVNNILKYGFEASPISDPLNSTHTRVEAPAGTHKIVFTTNKNNSLYAYLSNAVDEIFSAKKLFDNAKDFIKSYYAFSDDVAKSLLENAKENMTDRLFRTLQENVASMVNDGVLSGDKIKSDVSIKLLEQLGKDGLKNLLMQKFDLQKAFEDSIKYAAQNSGKIAADALTDFAEKICKGLLKGNPAIFGWEGINFAGNLLENTSQYLTEKKLENVLPMVIQVE